MTSLESTGKAILSFLTEQGKSIAEILGVSLNESMIFIWIGILILFLFAFNKLQTGFIKWSIIIFIILLLVFMFYAQ
ncbi:MAG: hypothetical protein PHW96_00820 [Candidatus Nanoarchaeia archaeon]|nr:hypothetical protein [Candidatus Nanoarchaeia archaeon]